jgi:hypothetical protein
LKKCNLTQFEELFTHQERKQLIAGYPCYVRPVEIFRQGEGILPRNVEKSVPVNMNKSWLRSLVR